MNEKAKKNNDLSGLSQTSMSVMNSEEGRQKAHQRPVGLTITVEKIDRVLTDIQAQIEFLRPFSRPRDHSHG